MDKELMNDGERLARIEEQLVALKESVDNHVAHLSGRVDSLDRKFWGVVILALTALLWVVTR